MFLSQREARGQGGAGLPQTRLPGRPSLAGKPRLSPTSCPLPPNLKSVQGPQAGIDLGVHSFAHFAKVPMLNDTEKSKPKDNLAEEGERELGAGLVTSAPVTGGRGGKFRFMSQDLQGATGR